MCEFDNSLIAWMDGELDADTALEVEQHLAACESCSARAAQYRETSQVFAAHYMSTPIQSDARRWRKVAIGTAAVLAAAAATVLWMLRPLPGPLPLDHAKVAQPPEVVMNTAPPNRPMPAKVAHHRAARKAVEVPAPWTSVEPTIEIVMPADAILAPGAVPAGFTFAADLSIAGDGSPEALRVRPTLYLK